MTPSSERREGGFVIIIVIIISLTLYSQSNKSGIVAVITFIYLFISTKWVGLARAAATELKCVFRVRL